MKKFVLAIFVAAAILSGCNEVETEDNSTPICFGEASSRAEVKDASEIKEFKVYAEMNLGSDSATDGSNLQWIPLLEGERVYRDNNGDGVTDETGNFTYDNTRYWVNDRTFRFFAYWPCLSENKEVAEDGLWKVEATSLGEYKLSFVTSAKADDDLLVANKTVVTTAGQTEYPTIDLAFQHQLTKICFKVNYDGVVNKGDAFKFKELTISNIKKSGTLTATSSTGTSNWIVDNTQNINYTWSSESPIDVPPHNSENATSINVWSDGLRLIPQTVEVGTVGLYIKYQYDDSKQGHFIDKEIITTLPAITWQTGLQYTYVITLHEDEFITFRNIEIEPWGSPQQGGAVIIK